MCKYFSPSLGSVLFALSLCHEISSSYFLTSGLASSFLVATTIASSAGKTSSVLLRHETPKGGHYSSVNVSTSRLCSSAPGTPASSDCKPTVLPVDSGNSMQSSNSTRNSSLSVNTKDTPVKKWQTSLRSKPGTSSLTSLMSPMHSSIAKATISISFKKPTQTLSVLATRVPKAKNVVIVYETSTKCNLGQNGTSSTLRAPLRTSSLTRPSVATITISSSSGALFTNLNVSSVPLFIVSSTSTKYTTFSSKAEKEGKSSSAGLSYSDPPHTSDSNSSSHRPSIGSSIMTIFAPSRRPLSTHLPVTTSSFNTSGIKTSAKLTSSSTQSLAISSNLTMSKIVSATSTRSLVTTGEVGLPRPRLTTSRTSSRPHASLVSSNTSSRITTSTETPRSDSARKRASSSASELSSSHMTSTAGQSTSNNNSSLSSPRTTSTVSSTLGSRPSSESISRSSLSSFSSPSSSSAPSPISNLASNVSISLTTCAVTPQTQPVTTLWMAGACKLT